MILHELLTALADGAGGEALKAFQALSYEEQLSTLDAELMKLSDDEKIRTHEAVRKALSLKWMAQPGPQTMALRSEADILLYGGAAGGGKTELLIGLALTQHKRSLIMRRHYSDLGFITERAVAINETRDGFSQSPQPKLRSGARFIEFGAAQHPGDEERFMGRPHDFIGVDEAAQFLEGQIRFLPTWLRTEDTRQRTRLVLATNPPLSDEGQWLISMFRPWLDPQHGHPAKPGELRWYISNAEGEDEEVVGRGPHLVAGKPVMALSRTFIPALVEDNAYYSRDDRYRAQLDALMEPWRSAFRDGNFMIARTDDLFQVIPSDWIRQAQARWTDRPPEGQDMTCIAVDSAGGGKDAAAIARRYGTWFAPMLSEKGPQTADGRYIGAKVLMERRNNCQIVVDIGGGYGGDTVAILKDNEAPVEGFKGADESSAKSVGSNHKFLNARAEAWWRFREALDPQNGNNVALPPNQKLAADLATPRYLPKPLQNRGIIQVESKEEIRLRLQRSPDDGDAVVMCWRYGGLREMDRRANPRFPTRANVGHEKAKRIARR